MMAGDIARALDPALWFTAAGIEPPDDGSGQPSARSLDANYGFAIAKPENPLRPR